jgi:hypothetical protein
MWLTLQKRLPTELFRAGCDTVEKANRFLQKYVDRYNELFAVEPMRPESFFIPCDKNLDDILTAQIPRKADSQGCIHFHSYTFAVLAPRVRCRDLVLHISQRGIYAKLDGQFYPVKILDDIVYSDPDERLPQVLVDIIYRYMFADSKTISA